MRNRIMGTVVLLVSYFFALPQTANEWFKQKETQLTYLIEQISALKAYRAVLKKGYDRARDGLSHIFYSKEADDKQHRDYFLSLWKVKAVIRHYDKVVSVYKMKAGIENGQRLAASLVTDYLNDGEQTYIRAVYANLLRQCHDLLAELERLTRDRRLPLKDDERIQGIDRVYARMLDRYQFSRSFSTQLQLLIASRIKQKMELDKMYSWYDAGERK